MIAGIASSARGGSVQSVRMDVLAGNLANSTSVGYKPRSAVIAPNARGEVGLVDVIPDFRPGRLRTTENPLNIALEGEGFFTVSDGTRRLYSRNGELSVNNDGQLVCGSSTFTLTGVSGNPIQISPDRPFVVTREGAVVQDGSERGRIGVVDVEQPETSLTPLGAGTFMARGPVRELEARARVQQGMVENSNMDDVTGMVKVLEATRAYEANMRMIGFQDSMLGRLVSQVGSIPA